MDMPKYTMLLRLVRAPGLTHNIMPARKGYARVSGLLGEQGGEQGEELSPARMDEHVVQQVIKPVDLQ